MKATPTVPPLADYEADHNATVISRRLAIDWQTHVKATEMRVSILRDTLRGFETAASSGSTANARDWSAWSSRPV